jgi:hypothetical protein
MGKCEICDKDFKRLETHNTKIHAVFTIVKIGDAVELYKNGLKLTTATRTGDGGTYPEKRGDDIKINEYWAPYYQILIFNDNEFLVNSTTKDFDGTMKALAKRRPIAVKRKLRNPIHNPTNLIK